MTFWREIVIVVLGLALWVLGEMYLSERDAHLRVAMEYEIKLKDAAEARKAILARSDETLGRLHAENLINVKKAQDHAYKNFIARFGNPALCVPQQPNLPGPTGTHAADRAEAPDGASKEPVVVAGFVKDCGLDAAAVTEFQQFVRFNKLPVEGE